MSALRSLVDGAPDGLLVMAGDGTIRYCNPAAADLLRRPPAELVGTRLDAPLREAGPVEWELHRDGADRRVCELRARPCRMNGEPLYLVAMRDATATVEARRRAEAEVDAKTELLTMIAHELRNPLGTIVGCLSMLTEPTFEGRPQQRRRLVEMSQGKAKELQRLVDDLLTSSRIETGRLQPCPRPVDLGELVVAAVERAQGRAMLLSARIEAVRPHRPVPAELDPDQVGIAIDNLVNNALTYSDGAPHVELRLEAAGGEATITVTDRGIGIAEADRHRIFAPFERATGGRRRGPGTGLGLAIARGLVDINRGTLELAWTRPGAGSSFVLRVPAIAASG